MSAERPTNALVRRVALAFAEHRVPEEGDLSALGDPVTADTCLRLGMAVVAATERRGADRGGVPADEMINPVMMALARAEAAERDRRDDDWGLELHGTD